MLQGIIYEQLINLTCRLIKITLAIYDEGYFVGKMYICYLLAYMCATDRCSLTLLIQRVVILKLTNFKRHTGKFLKLNHLNNINQVRKIINS